MSLLELQKLIKSKMPLVIPKHDKTGHWYEVPEIARVLPSVTTVLQIIKDDSIRNWRLNRAVDYVFQNYTQFTDTNILEHLEGMKRVSVDLLEDAGDIGTRIHEYRERLFMNKPVEEDPVAGIDVRYISAQRALAAFLAETGYVPVASELMVYSPKLLVAGTLDDIGLMPTSTRPGTTGCEHVMLFDAAPWKEYQRCVKCPLRIKYDLVLCDLKSSNQYKDSYHVQVALYNDMFVKLTGLKPKKLFILKVSKENGTYSIEDIKDYKSALAVGQNAVKLWYGMEKIRASRKPERIKL